MSIPVTGCAGFIGSNFVIDWLNQSDEPLDKLTYAGYFENLISLQDDARHIFIFSDIGDATLVSSLLAEHRPCAIISFTAEYHLDRSIHGLCEFIRANIEGTLDLLESVRSYWWQLPDAMDSITVDRLD